MRLAPTPFTSSSSASSTPGAIDRCFCILASSPPPLRDYLPERRKRRRRRHGEAAVLRQGGSEEGAVDARGGPHARLLRPGARPRQLARRADQHWADAVQQELPAAVDQLPPAGDQARQLHRPGGEAHRPPPGPPRQQVGGDSVLLAGEDGQRHQELLEHAPQEEAQEDEGRRRWRRRGRRWPARWRRRPRRKAAVRPQGAVGAAAADGHPHGAAGAARRALSRALAAGEGGTAAAYASGVGDVRVQRREHRAAAGGVAAPRQRQQGARGVGVDVDDGDHAAAAAVLRGGRSVRVGQPQRRRGRGCRADPRVLDGDEQDGRRGLRRRRRCTGVLDAGELVAGRRHGARRGGAHGRRGAIRGP